MQIELDEFEIEVGGVLVGLFFGLANLEPDASGGFHVHSIALDGRKASTERTEVGGLKTTYSNAAVILERHSKDPDQAFLFNKIASAIENDPGIQQQFHDERVAA